MDRAVSERLLRLIGLGVRARTVVIGVEQVRDLARRNKLAFAVVAPDGSENSLAKVVPLLTARRIRFVEGPTATELGAAVGREQITAVGVTDWQLAKGMRALVGRPPTGLRGRGV